MKLQAYNPIQRVNPGSYSEERKAKRLKMAGKGAILAADAYVASVGVLNPNASYAPWFGGLMAAGHGVMGLREAFTTDRYGELALDTRPKCQAAALGHFVTAAGFVSMAAGSGVLGVPLVAVGQVAVLTAEFLTKDEG